MVTVLGMSLIIISVALGIIYLIEIGLSMPTPFVFLIFAIFFTLGTVFFEQRGAIHPWSLVGGAISSLCITFVIISIFGGIRYVASGGLSDIAMDTVLYSLSACIIVSMITLNFAAYKLQYI